MRKLLLDVGNNRVKWARMQAGHYEYAGAIALQNLSVDSFLQQIWPEDDKPQQVFISSVLDDEWMRLLRFYIGNSWSSTIIELVAEKEKNGLTNGYQQPQRLGVDRWCALLGAWQLEHSAVCVVDAGTALTMDVVNIGGEHLGGLIAPGLKLMRDCLLQKSSHVNLLFKEADAHSADADVGLLGKNTAQAVTGGTLWTLAASVERLQAQAHDLVGGPMRCVITGGDAQALLPLLSGQWQYEADLVLQGLSTYAR